MGDEIKISDGPDILGLSESLHENVAPEKVRRCVFFMMSWEKTTKKKKLGVCTKTIAVKVSALKQGTDRGRPVLE